MSEENVSDDGEHAFVTVDGGMIVNDQEVALICQTRDAPQFGDFVIPFRHIRSVVLYPDGNDRGSIEFTVAALDSRADRTIERTLLMRVSAEEGLAEARLIVPELHKKSAGMNATPDPYLDAALHASASESIWQSWVSEQNDTPSLTDTPPTAAQPIIQTSPTEATRSTKPGGLRSRAKPLVGPALAVAVAAVISLVIFYPRQDSEPQQAAAAPAQTTDSTTSTAPTTTTTPRTASPTASRQSTTASRQSTTRASSIDAAFAKSLTDLGVDYSSPAQAVSVAKTTCRTIDNSANPANAILAASEIAQRSGGYTRTEANDFVGLAVLAYCPEYNSYVQN